MARRKKVEEEVYHVEVITKARVSEDGDWEYHVKWAGYDSDADSWEPQENVQQCDRLLASFWKHIGMDNEDYPIGYEVAAEEDWINKEKRYFAETFVKPSKRKSDKMAKKKDKQEKRHSKSRSNTPRVPESSTDDSESSDEEPPAKTHVTRQLSRNTRNVGTESESEPIGLSRKQIKVVSVSKATIPPPRGVPKTKRQVSSATGGSLKIAPPNITAIRTHLDQRSNPLVKSISLPSKSIEAGSSLSTKQRIAAGIPPPQIGPKLPPPAPRTSLPALSFKKNKLPILTSIQNKDSVILSNSAATPTSPVGLPAVDATKDTNMVASPEPMDIDQPADLFDSIMDAVEPPGESSETLTVSIPPKSQKEIIAEKFLQTVDIPVLNGPLEVTIVPDQTAIDLNKTLAISKIPKKWKWSGDLFISTTENKTELLCAVEIADPSGTSNSSHINLLLSSLDSLRISKLYPIMDLSPLLRACGRPQYFGRLGSNEPSEEMAIHGLEDYLTSEGLAAAITLFLDGTEVAVLVVFPGAQKGLTTVLQVPKDLLAFPLLVVLFPFLVSTNLAGWKPVKAVTQSPFTSQDMLVFHDLSQQVSQAMSLLCFPRALLDFFHSSATTRAYCIWPLPDQFPVQLDTTMLQCILKSAKAVPAKLEEDVRVIFISNRHLDRLHIMPSLVTRRLNSPEVQFWTYGYSTDMLSERWKVQEIYPLGGVVTFTPSALAEDFMGCHQLISKIIEHPLWDCYLIPEVLAVSHLLFSDGDFGSLRESCLGPILDWISLGLISAMKMPEKGCPRQLPKLSQIFNPANTSGHELLGSYLEALKSHSTTSSMTVEQLVAFTINEVTKDLSNAQVQPMFMEHYRRFVVIRAASEDTIPVDKDGLEWSPLSLFSFKDDYFQS